MNDSEEIVTKILEQKILLEASGIKPRIILLNEKIYDMIKKDWLESYRQLPWGDIISNELEYQIEKHRNIFLGDATLFGLWIVKVESVESFEVR